MRNVKSDTNTDKKGSISYTLGDRKYFGLSTENIMDKSKGYYSNSHYYIFDRFK